MGSYALNNVFRIISEKNNFDLLFDVDLKPLKSKNARFLFLIFLESSEVEHLTTLDIQDKLSTSDRSLHKKEINAWLSGLQVAGLITKEYERGKPTTIEYNGRYTYDLWKLTEKGKEIAKKLEIFLPTKTSLIYQEIDLDESNLDEVIQVKSINQNENNRETVSLLEAIIESSGPIDFDELRDRMLSLDLLLDMIKESKENGFLEFRLMEDIGLVDRILGYLGIPRMSKYLFRVTEKGYELLQTTVKKG
jgi:hypothetical protein